jgi:hypothetical protein
LVQKLCPPQNFKCLPFWNGWSYEIKKMWHRGHLEWQYLPTKFHENQPGGSKVISGEHTDRWSAKPNFIFWK